MNKPTSKKDYPFVVECETHGQTKSVLNHYDNNNDSWSHWKYVLVNSDEDNDIFDTKNFLNFEDKFIFISFSEWLQLPDYAPEEVAFTSKNKDVEFNLSQNTISMKKIIGYKLVKPEYEEAAGRIAYEFMPTGNYKLIKVGEGDINLSANSAGAERLQKAGVLDLWFEPVYAEDPYQELFNYISEQYNLTLLDSEMENIINIVNKIKK